MKFNKQTNEKERLLDLIKHAYKDQSLELEVLINVDKEKTTYNDFLNIIQRLKGQSLFVREITKEDLNIYFPNDSKYKSIRPTIRGNHAIKLYCSKDSKSSNKNKLPIRDMLFIRKEPYQINNRLARVDMNDYSLRFNLKKETALSKNESIVQDLITTWDTVPKLFRYKKIYSFITKDNQFRIDISIVRSSNTEEEMVTVDYVLKNNLKNLVIKPPKVKNFNEWWNDIKKRKKSKVLIRNSPKFFKNVETSNVFVNQPEYEVEVEYIGNKLPRNKSLDLRKIESHYNLILNGMFKYIGIIMQVLQRSFYVIGKKETYGVINNYKKLINLHTFSKNIFRGPQAVTLEKKNILRLTNKEYALPFTGTIRKDYLVTVKADGERNLMFINSNGKVYFINRENRVRYMGCKIPEYKMSIFDGEFINKGEKGEFLRNYYIFDVYYVKGVDVRDKKLGLESETNSRNKLMKLFVVSLQNQKSIFYEHPNFKLIINKKKYYSSNTKQSVKEALYDQDASNDDTKIFNSCREILNKAHVKYGGLSKNSHLYTYAIDGLIFMPRNLGVGQEYPEDPIVSFSKRKPWFANMKWKPHFFNSIDFSVKYNIDMTSQKQVEVYRNEKLYKQILLRVNYSPNFHGIFYNSLRVLNEGLITSGQEYLENFKPTIPFSGSIDESGALIEDLHITNIMCDLQGNMITQDGSIIRNGDVVEFVYDKNEEPFFRWKPKLIRPGKSANRFHTANQIWMQIHDPITIDMITTGNNITTSDITGAAYYKLTHSSKQYFSAPMKEYHNFVKGQLLEMAVYGREDVSLLDLGCGKMGDIHKYVNNNISFLVGVEYNHDNVYNFKDSGPIRVISNKHKSNRIKKLANNTMIVWGDASKNISSGESAMDVLNKYYLDVLYGKVSVTDFNKLNKMRTKATTGFDIVSCQFAIHYFFENREKLDGFFTNVYENLKEGGMFIGTCLDGTSIFNALKKKTTRRKKLTKKKGVKSKSSQSSQSTQQIEVKVNSKGQNYIESVSNTGDIIWSIAQNYPKDTVFNDNESSLGKEINFQYETFSKPTPEFLVNFEYMVNVLKNYGIELVDSKMFVEEPGSFMEAFKKYCNTRNKDHYRKFLNNPELLKCSGLHRWFIFIKKGNLQKSDVESNNDSDSDTDIDTQ